MFNLFKLITLILCGLLILYGINYTLTEYMTLNSIESIGLLVVVLFNIFISVELKARTS